MASENQIMAAVLSQLSVTKLDFQRLADDIGLSNSEAARSRWRRLKAKLDESVTVTSDASPKKASITSPSSRKETPKQNGNGKRARVIDKDDIEDIYDHDVDKRDEDNGVEKGSASKRVRGRPKRAVVGTSAALFPADDEYEEEIQDVELPDEIVDDTE